MVLQLHKDLIIKIDNDLQLYLIVLKLLDDGVTKMEAEVFMIIEPVCWSTTSSMSCLSASSITIWKESIK